jgi:uncharacterized protein (DUF2141 family)
MQGTKGMVWKGFLRAGVFMAALFAVLAAPAMAQPPAATLVVHIQDVSSKGGILRLGLYDEARYPDDDSTPVASADVPATSGETVITLANVPPGTYAIETFQDINSNDRMDTSWFGFPLEPFGFSRDARPRLAKPAFAKVKFEVTAGMNVQTVHLQDSLSLVAEK